MPVDEGEGRPDRSRKARIYVVKPGDSLSTIAKAVHGDADRWTEIFDANKDKIKDPNKIEAGQKLRIP